MSVGALAVALAVCLLGARAPWAAVGPGPRLETLRRTALDGCGARSSVPRSRPRPELDVLVVLDLLDAAIAAGAGLPRALSAVGQAGGGAVGQVLARASSALVMGADWPTAWLGAPARLAPVVTSLAPTWDTGAAPGPALRAAADHLRRERRSAAREAAGRLGVLLVLPLGVCFLPAFVLIGLVPVMISLGSGLLG